MLFEHYVNKLPEDGQHNSGDLRMNRYAIQTKELTVAS